MKIGDEITENELAIVGRAGMFCGSSRISLEVTLLNISTTILDQSRTNTAEGSLHCWCKIWGTKFESQPVLNILNQFNLRNHVIVIILNTISKKYYNFHLDDLGTIVLTSPSGV